MGNDKSKEEGTFSIVVVLLVTGKKALMLFFFLNLITISNGKSEQLIRLLSTNICDDTRAYT
jgi:hypothetical protein